MSAVHIGGACDLISMEIFVKVVTIAIKCVLVSLVGGGSGKMTRAQIPQIYQNQRSVRPGSLHGCKCMFV